MSEKMFSDGALIKMGWAKTKENIGLLIGAMVVAILAILVPPAILNWIGPRTQMAGLFALLAFLVYLFMYSLVTVGFLRLLLNLVDGKGAKISDLFSSTDKVLPFLLVSILYGLIVIGGLILLVFPGIIWSIKYMMAPYLVIDKGLKPVEALKESGRLTNGVKWDIFGFQQVVGTVIMIGYLALFIGIIVSIPVGALAVAGLYRHLSKVSVA